MKNLIVIIFVLFTIIGCISFSKADRLRKLVDISDGINEQEALVVARVNLLESNFKSYDQVIPPKIRSDEAALKYPDYWFINYSPAVTSNYPTLLMVIKKQKGEVVLTKEYWPNVVKDLDWVFKKGGK